MVEILIIAAYLTTVVIIFVDGKMIKRLHESCKDTSEENIWMYIIGMTIMIVIATLIILLWPLVAIGYGINKNRK